MTTNQCHLSLAVVFAFVLLSIHGCSEPKDFSDTQHVEPYGVFKLEGRNEYQIVIEQNNVYKLCKLAYCTSGKYIHVQENKKILKLLDFYKMNLGLEMEKIAIENGYIDGNYEMAIEYRSNNPFPNDLVFSVSDYCSSPCFLLGIYYSEGALFLRDNE